MFTIGMIWQLCYELFVGGEWVNIWVRKFTYVCAHTYRNWMRLTLTFTYVYTEAFTFSVAASLNMCLTLNIFSRSQVQWSVSSLCYSVESQSAWDPDKVTGEVNQSNRKGRKFYMRTKGKETCLKAMSSVEVGGFGLMSCYPDIFFPWTSKSISTKVLLTHQGEILTDPAFPKGNTAWTLESVQSKL